MLDAVLAYINHHLEETITLKDLAKVTGYSPYHLHRQLKTQLQEPVGNFIIKQRVQAASYLLSLTSLPVREVRQLVGYDNDSAFSRVFKNSTGQSPRVFRQRRTFGDTGPLPTTTYLSLKAEVVRLPERKALVFPCVGNYFRPAIYEVWAKAASFLAQAHLAAADFTYLGVLHDCQLVNSQQLCRYDAGLVPKQNGTLPAHRHFVQDLPGGKFVRYKFCCPVADYPRVGARVNAHLAVEMGLQHREGISFFEFQTLPTLATADNLFITWYLPVT
jgi:AraC family transcriptional regulator